MKLPSGVKPLLIVAGLAVVGYAVYANFDRIAYKVDSVLPEGDSAVEQGVIRQELQVEDLTTIASGLEIPWDIAFLPEGDLLVTERPGRLKRVTKDGAVREITGIEGTRRNGEGGLLGVAVHPKFSENGWVYLYQTITVGSSAKNRVDRYRLDGDTLVERTTILQNIPGAIYHDGGEVVFGPDGKLYVTTGDATQSALSQDLKSLSGKILRLNDDGTIPGDNPFGTAVWSYGHRNPQGLAWDGQGRLWATEHGRSGVLSGLDELNMIEPGKNYGWPVIQGDETAEGMVAPVVNSGPNETWAPSGMAFKDGSLYFGGLRGESLYQARIGKSPIEIVSHFEKEYGRIRAVVLGPDRMLYITTSNRDGRGTPREGDDKIIRVNPRLFQ
ncbi:MAG TPA: PQQ-dependent sugar dehydrogenase [Candidatus Baltobacteraceae bacterium]|nr:PQQ-dependent sugar dehydrogenase [Candidatus Baltobacteraceae bacterium]